MQGETQIILRGKSNRVVPWSGKNSNHTRSCGKKQQNTERKYEVNNYDMESNNKNIERWCKYTMQGSYTTDVTLHRPINTTPYEAVFGITAHRENHQNTDEGETTELASGSVKLLKEQPNARRYVNDRVNTMKKW